MRVTVPRIPSHGFYSFLLGLTLTSSVPGSPAWRIPLGVQIIPGIFLGVGCMLLPPSPRLLVLLGEHDKALASLRKLRGTEAEGNDALVEVRISGSLEKMRCISFGKMRCVSFGRYAHR